MTVRIRSAGPADAPVMARLAHALLREILPQGKEPPLAALERATVELWENGPGFAALLAETEAGEAVGLAALSELGAAFALGRFGEITELYVAPTWRSRGVGELLLAEAQAHARRSGWTRLELTGPHHDEAPGAERALDFYRRQGFVEAGMRLKLKL